MSDRLNKVLGQINAEKKQVRSSLVSSYTSIRNPDDIVVVSAKRTAQTRGRKGGLKDTKAADLLAPLFKEVTKDIDPNIIEEIVVGTVLSIGTHRHIECRQAGFL